MPQRKKFKCKSEAQKKAIRANYAKKRANKPKRKWNKSHFFKRKKSTRRQVGHPVLVYATSKEDYRYLIFTHKPEDGKEDDYDPLRHNIDKNDTEPCYVKKKFGQNHQSLFEPPDKDYRIHDDDKNTVRKHKRY